MPDQNGRSSNKISERDKIYNRYFPEYRKYTEKVSSDGEDSWLYGRWKEKRDDLIGKLSRGLKESDSANIKTRITDLFEHKLDEYISNAEGIWKGSSENDKSSDGDPENQEDDKYRWHGVTRSLFDSVCSDGKTLYPFKSGDSSGFVDESEYGKETPEADPEVLDRAAAAVVKRCEDIFAEIIPALAAGKTLEYQELDQSKQQSKEQKGRTQDVEYEKLKEYENELKNRCRLIVKLEKKALSNAEKESAETAVNIIADMKTENTFQERLAKLEDEFRNASGNALRQALQSASERQNEELKELSDNEISAYTKGSDKLMEDTLNTAQVFFKKAARQLIDVYGDKRNDENALITASNKIIVKLVSNVEKLMKEAFRENDKRTSRQIMKSKSEALKRKNDEVFEKAREKTKKDADRMKRDALKQKNKIDSAVKRQLGKLDALAGK